MTKDFGLWKYAAMCDMIKHKADKSSKLLSGNHDKQWLKHPLCLSFMQMKHTHFLTNVSTDVPITFYSVARVIAQLNYILF